MRARPGTAPRRKTAGVFAALLAGGVSTLGLAILGFYAIGCDYNTTPYVWLLIPVIFCLLALTRLRILVWAATLCVVAALIVVGYTPLMPFLVRSDPAADRLEPVDAVVVLSSSVESDGSLDDVSQARFMAAYEVLRKGYAPRLVITDDIHGNGPPTDAVRAQMKEFDLAYPIVITGPVTNTHDEALQTAKAARANGWKRVILVTQRWHMARARALFQHAGLAVLCDPCVEPRYDMRALEDPASRYAAFRDWFHEWLGMAVYRHRHWI